MSTKPWLATYASNNIPASINADAYPSVVHMMEEAMAQYADQPAFCAFGQTLSYADVDRQSAAFAAWLQQRLGVGVQDPVAHTLEIGGDHAIHGIAAAATHTDHLNPRRLARHDAG